ncbi:hypothetical protein [Nocardia yunnanensis]|uniref:hypothetical protein n=1 Tax=Nocardia yunnanensis TaxID=2382165 RepID=UPI0013C50A5F|nr:hypothetical protein [Nocardia yunnanensis]
MASVQVQWSPRQQAYVAWSEQCPGLCCVDRWSSLAAVDALIETAADTMPDE